ncbi:hypothetical protein J5N97_011185 [Dioscorea zingiberensis]|uniref:Uncharacterized protein n=1 Tax=Dioscorea zingiberensis TaxID=325984 RepID=A0A9D5D2K3_9LILI|nr:hypothetical protein J5N97_011185 [Dioscorea zingiberensis]
MISAVELAKKLIDGHGRRFHVTILNMQHHFHAWAAATTSYVNSIISSGLDIHFEDLPKVEPPPNKENMKGDTFMCLLIEAHKAHVRDAVARHLATSTVAALVFDFMCASMLDVAKEFNMPGYIYIPSNASFLGLMLYLPTLHAKEDVNNVVDIPVLRSAPPSSMPEFMMDKKGGR